MKDFGIFYTEQRKQVTNVFIMNMTTEILIYIDKTLSVNCLDK